MTEPLYFNRELSWLAFNQRVLDEAIDADQPLLERLRFLAITASNLDEFFMVRVGGLTLVTDRDSRDPSGLTPAMQLEAISRVTHQMMRDQYDCFVNDVEPAMAAAGIRRLQPAQLNERQAEALELVFDAEIFPVATPMAVDQDRPFPVLGNQMLHACVRLSPAGEDPRDRFAIVPLGHSLSRVLTVPADGGYCFLLIEDAVRAMAQKYFPGELVEECVAFRITRNADFAVDDDEASDLLLEMQQVLTARREGGCVRLELERDASDALREFLMAALRVDEAALYVPAGPLDLASLMPLCDLGGYEALRFAPWTPQPAPEVDETDMFATIAAGDLLLHHPYDSFDPVVRLIQQAAQDPDVIAIKQILYRTSRDSPVVSALRDAAKQGKYVTTLVELKARFDEARNIEWARSLEQAGAQVIYGIKGLKTHAKICVIVRREPHGIQRYVHFGTGNYNERTARLYTDVSYFTCREALGLDASRFFNAITGFSQPLQYNCIEAAPLGLRERLLELIDGETQRRKQGEKARIFAKMNSLVDPEIIQALYTASDAGVKIRLNVRGICCLRPGVSGLSENIEVVSIVDRFLEHSRICYFLHGGDEQVYISSADWMPRNLDRRVELLVPIEDESSKRKVIRVLEACFDDNVKARRLLPNGSYQRLGKGKPFRAQQCLMDEATEAVRQAQQLERTQFTPHKPSNQ
ncbi:MAG: polyphosphate kinase 1 [Planctomycetales bacterium]|nr:polyphosphate kinase 1 [Planctomycetales bacterium]